MSQITVKVHTKSSKPRVEFLDNTYHAYISVIPQKGEANEAVLKALADFLRIPKTQLKIVSGFKNRTKQIELAQ